MPLFAQKRDDSSNTIYRVIRRGQKNTRIANEEKLIPTNDLIFVRQACNASQSTPLAAGKPTSVPVTPLRMLYEWMKTEPPKGIGYSFLHEPIAEQFVKHPRQLVDLFIRSVDDFRRFANENEGFHPKRDAVTPENRRKRGTTTLQTLAEGKKSIPIKNAGNDETNRYIYLDREIAPGRITNADTSGPNPAGKGGIDFLLARKFGERFIPVVAEVKIRYDKTPLLALVQVLTYAAELTSAAQRRRILNAYSDGPLKDAQLHDGMELLLLFIELPTHLNSILDLTRTIIEKLCADRRLGNYVSRIVVASQPRMPPDNGPFELQVDEMEEFLVQK